MYQQPDHTPNYGPHDFTPPHEQLQTYNGGDLKTQGARFKPKNRINDPIFLIFFVLQAWLYRLINLLWKVTILLVSRIHRLVRHSLDYMDIARRIRGRSRKGRRSNGEFSNIEQVLMFPSHFLVLNLSTGAPSICFFLLPRWQCSSQSFISFWPAYSPKPSCTSPWFLRLCSTCISSSLSLFHESLFFIHLLQWYMCILLDNQVLLWVYFL